MTRARELREQWAKIHADVQLLLGQGMITQEDKRKFDMMMGEMDTLKREIDGIEARKEWA